MRVALLTFGFAAAAAACSGHSEPPALTTTPARPASGQQVPPGTTLQQAIDAAPAGATLLLQPGEYQGPFRIEKALVLWGPPTAVLRASTSSTVRVKANGVTLAGFTVTGSGQRFDLMDGGIYVQGDDHVIDGVTVRETLFGILVEGCKRAVVRGNTVIGTGLPAMGLRGDGIRLWETSDSVLERNTVLDSRDVVVWYSSRNRLSDNTVRR